MSMYTESIKSIIEITAYRNDITLGADLDKYIKVGREKLFPGSYPASADFMNLFTESFIIHYFNENIIDDFSPLWLKRLQLQTQRTIKPYSDLYDYLKTLSAEDLSREGLHTTVTKRDGKNNESNTGKTETESGNKTSVFPSTIDVSVSLNDIKYNADGSKSESTGKSQNDRHGDFIENLKTTDTNFTNLLEKFNLAKMTDYDLIKYYVDTFSNLFIQVW